MRLDEIEFTPDNPAYAHAEPIYLPCGRVHVFRNADGTYCIFIGHEWTYKHVDPLTATAVIYELSGSTEPCNT
jgi:hypothetical protein